MFVWSQEEHRNMGAWTFVKPRFENMCGQKVGVSEENVPESNDNHNSDFVEQLKYYGRCEAATPAVGVSAWHKIEAADVVTGPFTI